MKEKFYTVAIRKRKNGDRFFDDVSFSFEEVLIKSNSRYWIADPFIFEYKEQVFLFYEAFDLVKQVGSIGYSVLDDDGSFSKPKIIIKGHHKSFPFVFEKDGQVYLIPESCIDNRIVRYKAVSFPNQWLEDTLLVSNVFSVDTIQVRDKDNREYLLTSEQYRLPKKGVIASCWVKNRIFAIYESNGSVSKVCDQGVVVEGEIGIRNAGAMFKHKGLLFRPGQNCLDGQYGRGLMFYSVSSVLPYKEDLNFEIDYSQMQQHIDNKGRKLQLVGTHTYNSSMNYEVIDIAYYEALKPWVFFKRLVYRSAKKIYGLTKKIYEILKRTTKKIVSVMVKKHEDIYFSIVDKSLPWVFVSYIADPFYHNNDAEYLNLHQNKRETLAMAEVFNKLGYNACFMKYDSTKELPSINVVLIFGHDPNIRRAKEKYKNAKVVYYGVSTYSKFRNAKIRQMTDDFNNTFHVKLPYERLVGENDSLETSDSVLLIGSKKTVQTFPEKYRGKITTIHQSTQKSEYLQYLSATGSKEFIFLASGGNALKGVGPLLQYFQKNPQFVLHWIGTVEPEVRRVLDLLMLPNVITYGFQDISSHLVIGLMERCDFILYPSGVEGVPGSVLNAMKNGLIPLVTPWASFDGIEDYGFVMEEANEDGIESAVNWAMNLSRQEINRRKKACQEYVIDTFNIERFKLEFEEYMGRQLLVK